MEVKGSTESGFDPSKVDWNQIASLIESLIRLFTGNHQLMASAVGCDEDKCKVMHEAICNNLKAADLCLQCCQSDNPPA